MGNSEGLRSTKFCLQLWNNAVVVPTVNIKGSTLAAGRTSGMWRIARIIQILVANPGGLLVAVLELPVPCHGHYLS